MKKNSKELGSIKMGRSAVKEFYGYAIACFVIMVFVFAGVIYFISTPTNIIVASCIAIGILKCAQCNLKLAKANSNSLKQAIVNKCGFEIITSLKVA